MGAPLATWPRLRHMPFGHQERDRRAEAGPINRSPSGIFTRRPPLPPQAIPHGEEVEGVSPPRRAST